MQSGKEAMDLIPAKTTTRIAIGTAALGAATIAAAVFLYPRIEPAAISYSIRGVDVSAHNGTLDWVQLKTDKVAFAFIKATEGGDFIDREFANNWSAAAKAGVPHGAYHFFTQCRTGLVQAQHFISTVPNDSDALPPVIDAEHMGPCAQGPTVKDVAAEIEVFLDEVEARLGKRPIIYTTQEFHDAYLRGLFAGERFWVRNLFFPPGFRQNQWTFWQYHNRGYRNGASGPIDLNAYRGTQADLDALMK